MGRPKFIECSCCGYYHPEDFWGDCRDDANRFTADDLDKKYGQEGWNEGLLIGNEYIFECDEDEVTN